MEAEQQRAETLLSVGFNLYLKLWLILFVQCLEDFGVIFFGLNMGLSKLFVLIGLIS